MNPLPSDPLGLSDPLRNPERLTAEQIGEGYMCLTPEQRAEEVPCECYLPSINEWETSSAWCLKNWTLRCPIHPSTGTPSDAESILGPQRPMTPDERAALDSFTSSELQPQPESEVKPCKTHTTQTAHVDSSSPVAVQSGDTGEPRSPLTSVESALTDEVLKLRTQNAELEKTVTDNALKLGAIAKVLSAELIMGYKPDLALIAETQLNLARGRAAKLAAENASLRSQVEELTKEITRWKSWAKYAQSEFTKATGRDLQASA